MIYLILPCGSNFGWGICGKYLVKELCDLSEATLLTKKFDVGDIGDELEYHLFSIMHHGFAGRSFRVA